MVRTMKNGFVGYNSVYTRQQYESTWLTRITGQGYWKNIWYVGGKASIDNKLVDVVGLIHTFLLRPNTAATMKNGFFGFRIDSYQTKY